jgi:molybdopterin synthase sulfur carrier subunit
MGNRATLAASAIVQLEPTRISVPQVHIPSTYRVPTKGEGSIEVEASTVRACIEAVEALYPGFQELILNTKGELHLFSKLFLNGELLDRGALDTPVSGDDIVAILAPAAGG